MEMGKEGRCFKENIKVFMEEFKCSIERVIQIDSDTGGVEI